MHSHSERKEREKLVCITLTLVDSLPNKSESDHCYHLCEENKRCDKLNKKTSLRGAKRRGKLNKKTSLRGAKRCGKLNKKTSLRGAKRRGKLPTKPLFKKYHRLMRLPRRTSSQ